MDEKHSLGIPGIDAQHQEFFLITNKFWADQDQPAEHRPTLERLKQLYAYTKYHFSSEEGMFTHYQYPQAKVHSQRHLEFSQKIRQALTDVKDGFQPDIPELLDYLVKWILFHIQDEDRQYSEFFQRQGINPQVHFTASGAQEDEALKVWNEKQLSLEIKGIDGQHKELVYILQQVNDLVKTSANRQKFYLPSIIQKLYYYTQYHFSFEEELMSRHGFPEIPQHKELHGTFIRKLLKFSKEYNLGVETLTEEIGHFLKDRTIHHILEEDRKLKGYLTH